MNLVPKPTSLMLYGEVGLMLLVLEAGLDVDIEMLKLIGARGVGIAISGSIMPLCIASLLASQVIGLHWKPALAVGCTLAPYLDGDRVERSQTRQGAEHAHRPADHRSGGP